jgi:hypothetical protein
MMDPKQQGKCKTSPYNANAQLSGGGTMQKRDMIFAAAEVVQEGKSKVTVKAKVKTRSESR